MVARAFSRFVFAAVAAASLFGCATARGGMIWREEPEVRVRLVHTLSEVKGAAGKAWHVYGEGIRDLGAIAPGAEIELKSGDDGVAVSWRDPGTRTVRSVSATWLALKSESVDDELLFNKVPFGVGWWWESAEDRGYNGRIEVRAQASGKLLVVCALPLEDYLLGVVPSEIGGGAPPEAAKAQAVAARSEVVTALRSGIYKGDHYDICADVDCQVFSGNKKRTAESDRAVWETEGLVLMHGGEPIGAYYASNCGGCSEDVQNVWPSRSGPKPYWSGHFDSGKDLGLDLRDEAAMRRWIESEPDVWCAPSKAGIPEWARKNFRWERTFTAEEMQKAVAKKKDVGRVLAVKVRERGVSGRIMRVEFVGEKGNVEVSPELPIRQLFDGPLKSAAFVVDVEGPAGAPDKFVLNGAGYGHGVGMCQTGAIARATAGQTFDQILTAYYTESVVERCWGK